MRSRTARMVRPAACVLLAALAASAVAQEPRPKRLDVPYVPTPPEVVAAMLDAAKVTADDVVYDLGCGDGRIVVAAARDRKARGVGIDIDPKRIAEAKALADKEGVADRVEIRQGDLFREDFSEATVVTMYLLPSVNARLMPRLAKLKPGTRIVSHSFTLGRARPVETIRVPVDKGGERTVYLYVVPWEEDR